MKFPVKQELGALSQVSSKVLSLIVPFSQWMMWLATEIARAETARYAVSLSLCGLSLPSQSNSKT